MQATRRSRIAQVRRELLNRAGEPGIVAPDARADLMMRLREIVTSALRWELTPGAIRPNADRLTLGINRGFPTRDRGYVRLTHGRT
jgi:hypothetical protein